jgi:hypothetical protein
MSGGPIGAARGGVRTEVRLVIPAAEARRRDDEAHPGVLALALRRRVCLLVSRRGPFANAETPRSGTPSRYSLRLFTSEAASRRPQKALICRDFS